MVRGSVPGHAQALSALRQARSGGAAAQNPPRVLPARRTAGGPNIFFSERTRSEETADVPFRDVTRCPFFAYSYQGVYKNPFHSLSLSTRVLRTVDYDFNLK